MENFSLTKIAKVAKSELFLIMLAVVSISIFSIFVFTVIKGKNKESKTINRQIPWKAQVIPGQTNIKKLNSLLGNPLKTENSTYYYPSINPKRPHLVEVSQDKVALVREQVIAKEKGQMKDYVESLGQPDAILYGEHEFAAPGHFWGKRGLLVFGNDNSGIILEIWYFEPSTLEDFLLKYPELKKEPSRNY